MKILPHKPIEILYELNNFVTMKILPHKPIEKPIAG